MSAKRFMCGWHQNEGGRQEILGTPESGKEQVMRGDKGIFIPCDP